jgi:hypothetical protein
MNCTYTTNGAQMLKPEKKKKRRMKEKSLFRALISQNVFSVIVIIIIL